MGYVWDAPGLSISYPLDAHGLPMAFHGMLMGIRRVAGGVFPYKIMCYT